MTDAWTVRRTLDWTAGYFGRRGIESPRLDAELLLASVLGCPRLKLYLVQDTVVPPASLKRFRVMIEERARRVPVSYVLGKQEFMGMEFSVTSDTLIPRPETELLVEEALKEAGRRTGRPSVVDVCTGSGNIAVSIARLVPTARVFATDISDGALETAHENAARNGQLGRVELRRGDLFGAIEGEGLEGAVDMVLSNPPYVALDEFSSLEPELGFEPRIALDGGADGLTFYRRLASGAGRYLRPDGVILLEMHSGKAALIAEILEENGLKVTETVKDYSGFDRVAVARRGARTME